MTRKPVPIAEARRKFAMQEAQQQVTNPNYISPKLKVVDPVQLDGITPPDRRWVVQDWIPHGSVTMINGDGGVGKTLLTQMLMTCCAAERKWMGLETTRCKALGIFCEDDEYELHRRQVAINEHYDLDWCDLENMGWFSGATKENALHIFNKELWQWDPSQFFQEIHDIASDEGYQLIVLDSLHDLFAGNENARPEARRFIQMLHSLARDIEGTVLLNAHPSKAGRADGSGESGSTAWNNSVRSRLYLSRPKDDEFNDGDKDYRTLTRQKSNYARIGEGVRIKWQDGVLISQEPETGFLAHLEGKIAERVFIGLLEERIKQNRPVSHKNRSGNYAPKEFARSSGRQGLKKQDFERAMEELFETGKIRVEQYGRQSDQRERIAINRGVE